MTTVYANRCNGCSHFVWHDSLSPDRHSRIAHSLTVVVLKPLFPFIITSLADRAGLSLRLPSDRWINRQLLVVWLLLGLGLALRFANLALKPVWLDEAFTLFHVAGFTDQFANSQLVTGFPVTVADLLIYQQPYPAHSVWLTIQNIADRAPELPPLYFVLLYLWMKLLGSSLLIVRSLSVLISLLIFPAVYWLCLELFALPIVGWYAMALVAVSPFHLNLAQEIRPYSLWTVCFLVSFTLFLRAQRLGRWRDWLSLSVALLFGLYTHLFMLLPWLVYGVQAIVVARGRLTRNMRRFVVASGVTLVGFLPWAWFGFFRSVERPEVFVRPHGSQLTLLKGVTQGIARFFVDFSLNESSHRWALIGYGICVLSVLGLAIYAMLYLIQAAERRSRWLLWLMVGLPIGLFVGSDLLSNASRTAFTRYYVPSAIALEITIAYLFASKHTLRLPSAGRWPRWQCRWIALLLVGACSSAVFVIAPTWWSKTKTDANACIIRTTQAAIAPLLITDEYYVRSLGLAHQLPPDVKLQFYPIRSQTAPKLDTSAQSTYLFMPSVPFLAAMQAEYELQPACNPDLWQVH